MMFQKEAVMRCKDEKSLRSNGAERSESSVRPPHGNEVKEINADQRNVNETSIMVGSGVQLPTPT
jgi:hypothetical protein